jgi:hypothetical protein
MTGRVGVHLRFRSAAALFLLLGGFRLAEAQTLQCVPFARQQSGISLRGDAWTWWTAAAGQYDRGQAPRKGAVVVFKKHGSMLHGHVAVVADVISARKLRVDHANWAPHRGRGRGQVAKMVIVTDVSPRNDWSEVRVWNDASGELGTRTYPTYGFIYPRVGRLSDDLIAVEALADSAPTYAASLAADVAPIGGEPLADDAWQGVGLGQSFGVRPSGAGAIASLTDLLTPPAMSAIFAVEPTVAE